MEIKDDKIHGMVWWWDMDGEIDRIDRWVEGRFDREIENSQKH